LYQLKKKNRTKLNKKIFKKFFSDHFKNINKIKSKLDDIKLILKFKRQFYAATLQS